MSTITAAANFPIDASGPFGVSGGYAGSAYSGTFIPAVWSGKFNAKFYATSTFADVSNTNWEGEISGMGDKVIIHTAPTITTSKYKVGEGLTYGVPEPETTELNIDRGRYFAFQVNDVLAYQSKPDLIDVFSEDAMEHMRIGIDSTCWYNTFTQSGVNRGATAGVNSGSYDLGTLAAPIDISSADILVKILEMASVLDEQNVPSEDRWLVIDPATRVRLLQSDLAKAFYTGDAKSPVRNGLIGEIDRFRVYVSNLLPRIETANQGWKSGNGEEGGATGKEQASGNKVCRAIIAGHKSALTFASQFTKTEQVRNPNDFGDYVRSLNVFGTKAVKPEAMALLVVEN